MALTAEAIGQAAIALIQQGGLASLSMRAVATSLGVAPGALYWHVASKQELLALVGDSILAAEPFAAGEPPRPAGRLARDLRASLLAVRDGAEIVSFARALHPGAPGPAAPIRAALAGQLPPRQSDWTARTLVHFILGAVAEEQNRAELARAGIGGYDAQDATGAFDYGITLILRGLEY